MAKCQTLYLLTVHTNGEMRSNFYLLTIVLVHHDVMQCCSISLEKKREEKVDTQKGKI